MVRIYSPSTSSPTTFSGARDHPSQQFGGPGFHEPMFPPPPLPETAAPHGHLDHRIHFSPPPSPPPSDMVSFPGHLPHRDHFPPPPSHMVSLLPAPHPFISHNHSPPPPSPSHGHDHYYPQQFGSPPPPPPPPSLGYHHPPPPPHGHGHGHGHNQLFGRPASQEPMHFPPPAHESGAPFGGHPRQFGYPPPPSLGHHHPSPPSHGRPQQFGRSAIHEPMLSPPPAQKSGSPHLFVSRNRSPPPPPPLHGHHHPPPPSHGHSHGHHRSQQFGSPHAFHEGMLFSSIDLEPAAPHMFMRGNYSPPPPPHLDYYNHSHSPPSPPDHRYSGALHHPHRFSRPAIEMEAPHLFKDHHSPPPPPPPPQGHHSHSSSPPPPHSHHSHSSPKIESPHLFMDHLHRSHSPPPPSPPPPHGHHSHSSPFHGFQHHGGQVHMQPPAELLEEAIRHHEPVMSGTGHPSHQFPGHPEGMSSSWLPSKEEHSPPRHHEMGGGDYDHFNLQRDSWMPRGMGGAHQPHEIGGAHRGRRSPSHPRSPSRKHRRRPVGPPSYPRFCAPHVPATHLSNAHPAHLAVPVW